MAQRLESNPKNPALFLLAMLAQAGGSASLTANGIKIEPSSLLPKLKNQIQAHKADFIRLLAGLDCVFCGFPVRTQGKARIEAGKWNVARFCSNPACGKQADDHVQPDFPIYGKDGKEI